MAGALFAHSSSRRRNGSLRVSLLCQTRRQITVQISATRNHLKVITSRSVGKRAAETITRDVRHMFRLDEDLTPFYQAMYANPEFEWIRSEGAGRLLRSP